MTQVRYLCAIYQCYCLLRNGFMITYTAQSDSLLGYTMIMHRSFGFFRWSGTLNLSLNLIRIGMAYVYNVHNLAENRRMTVCYFDRLHRSLRPTARIKG